tara:strand:- start:427 stop:537 length:111 start_codon:yes stop_codon:yes gene_type:complete
MSAQTMMMAISSSDGLHDLVPKAIMPIPIELDLGIR